MTALSYLMLSKISQTNTPATRNSSRNFWPTVIANVFMPNGGFSSMMIFFMRMNMAS
jgi:hypothetical protein